MSLCFCLFVFLLLLNYLNAAYPAVYGQFPQAIPQPLAAVAPSQREGKFQNHKTKQKKKHERTSCRFWSIIDFSLFFSFSFLL